MKIPDKVLVVEDDRGTNKRIVDGLSHLLSEMELAVDVVSAYSYEEGLMLAKKLHFKSLIIDINLPNNRNGIDLVVELRSLGYTYTGVVYATEQSNIVTKVEAHQRTKNTLFLTKPFKMRELAGEVAFHLNAPDFPKDRYLPTLILNNIEVNLNRETTIAIQKINYKDKIEVFKIGRDLQTPIIEEYPIETFSKVIHTLFAEGEKQFWHCERVTIINTDLIEELNSIKHYVILTGCPMKFFIGPKFREKFYATFRRKNQ